MKIKLYTLLITALTTLFISCGDNEKTTGEKAPEIAVKTVIPEVGQGSTLSLNGRIETKNNANLSTRMMGYVRSVDVEIGDKVRKGELLVSINNSDLQAQLAQVKAKITEAEVAFSNAEKDYKRFKNLYDSNSATQKELDDVSAQYEMAGARLEAANQMKNEVQAQFAYVSIRAPFDGVITNKFVEEGDMASPGMPIVALEAPGEYEVKATVPESEVSLIQTGTPVKVNIKSLDKTLNGTISEVSTSSRNTAGQYPVKVSLQDTLKDMRSGMYVNIEIPVKTSSQELNEKVLIPSEAIVNRGDLTGVYTVSSQNTALLRWIRLGKSFGDKTEVLSGLKADEEFILNADGRLYNGAPVSRK